LKDRKDRRQNDQGREDCADQAADDGTSERGSLGAALT
jgi:hypothetical protein